MPGRTRKRQPGAVAHSTTPVQAPLPPLQARNSSQQPPHSEPSHDRTHSSAFFRSLLAHLSAIEKFFAGSVKYLRSIYSAMPSMDVAVTLKASLHRDPSHEWRNNDIYDISALALTIPYCDVVVTDNSMWSHVTRHKLPERYDTVVISQLAALPTHI